MNRPDDLRTREIFDFYDQPILFSAESEEGLFLVILWERDGEESWLFARLSEERYSSIVAGEIDLHDAFWEAEALYMGTIEQAEAIARESLNEDDLPVKGIFLRGE